MKPNGVPAVTACAGFPDCVHALPSHVDTSRIDHDADRKLMRLQRWTCESLRESTSSGPLSRALCWLRNTVHVSGFSGVPKDIPLLPREEILE